MRANVGDRLVIKGHNVGDHDRDAEILEVRGPDGTPPWVVRWDDTGHETLFYPGPDAVVQALGVEPASPVDEPLVGDLMREEHRHLLTRVQRLLDAADDLDDATSLPDSVHEAHAMLTGHVLPHAHGEDDTVYRVVEELLGAPGAADPMRRQHVEIERLSQRLERLREEALTGITPGVRRNLRQVLHALHANLVVHLATEEEIYLPLLESKLSPRRSRELAHELHEAEHVPHPPVTAPSAT